MFANPGLNVPILGVIENMSWFTPGQHPDEKYYLFGQGGGALLASEIKARLLAQIPLIMEVGEAAELGENIFDKEYESVVRINVR